MTYEAPLDREICLMGFICMKGENYMKVDFENSFELLSKEEWNQYLSEEKIDSIMVDKGVFAKFSDKIMMYPILMEEIDELNNKVGSIKVSYALCRHYYDKGIPDKPYYISPGKDGQSVQYFPNFKNEHWMRLYWFNHFADAAYMKLFSVWDSVTEILDTFYGMNIDKNMRFKFRVMDELKQKDNTIWSFLKNDVLNSALYQEAEKYRNSFAHYTGPSTVSNNYIIQKDKEVEFPKMQDDGTIKMIKKKATVLSYRVGDYTFVDDIISNILDFSEFTGKKISKLLTDIVS